MQTNKQQRDKIVKQLGEARDKIRAAHTTISPQEGLKYQQAGEELIVKAIANLYRLNL